MAPKPATKKPVLTHFMCVPLVTASSSSRWRASLEQFTAETTNPRQEGGGGGGDGDDASGMMTTTAVATQAPLPLPAKAIRPLHSIHLTLGVMSLRDQKRVDEAKKALAELDLKALLAAAAEPKLGEERGKEERKREDDSNATSSGSTSTSTSTSNLPSKPLRVTFRSLHAMQQAHKTSVLYAAPDGDDDDDDDDDGGGRLLHFCAAVRDALATATASEHGPLIEPDTRPLKLHATVVNTLYARDRSRGGDAAAKARARAAKKRLPDGWGRPKPSRANNTAAADPAFPAGSSAGAGGGARRQQAEDAREDEGNDPSSGMKDATPSPLDKDGKIDARWLIERWKDHVWAEVTIERVAICEMGAKEDENGEVRYKEIAISEL